MNRFFRWFLCLAAAVAWTGCQTVNQPPPDIQAIGQRTFPGREPVYFHVPSHGAVGDAAMSALNAATPSQKSRELAEVFQRAVTQRTEVVIYGDNDEKVVQVIEEALAQQVGKLPGLHIRFVGDDQYRTELVGLLGPYNARLH